MSKLNVSGNGPLQTEAVPSGKTHNAAPGYKRTTETELYMHATTRFFGEDSYYEDAAVADERLRELTRSLAETPDGYAWLCGFAPYLRKTENIRTAALVTAAEAVSMRIDRRRSMGHLTVSSLATFDIVKELVEGPLTNRQLLNAVQVRADEPCELLAWALQRYGRSIPIPFKRGIGDGATRLWDERAVLRYDKPDRPVRMADVLELAHPKKFRPRPGDPRDTGYGRRKWEELKGSPAWSEFVTEWTAKRDAEIERFGSQGVLFRHLITVRRGRESGLDGKPYEPPAQLRAIRARWELNRLAVDDRHFLMRRVLEGDTETEKTVQLAMAGQHEWLRSWLGGKND